MRVLIVKTSSMGDIIHTLPALTDAGLAIPGIQFDWLVEKSFAEIPAWHPLVDKVIPIAFRRWRKNIFSKETRAEWRAMINELRSTHYDMVIDAQGLVKSAFIACMAKGRRHGYDFNSAREHLASIFYDKTYTVTRKQHAVTRMRHLFSQALNYALPNSIPDYGIDRAQLIDTANTQPYYVFLHGTTWETKHWPEAHWIGLAKLVSQAGFDIKLPWGNDAERERAERIAVTCKRAEVLPKLNIAGVAKVLAGAVGAVAVDTGLGHLAAALGVPTVSIYGPTDPVLCGALGKSQIHLSAKFSCAPCLSRKCHYSSLKRLTEDDLVLDQSQSFFPPCFSSLMPADVFGTLDIPS